MSRAIAGAGLMVCTSFGMFGQTPAATPSFEVASVKHAPPPTGMGIRMQMGGDPGRVNYANVTLKIVMARAYGVKENQITGPDWLNSERYDIVATVAPDTPRDQIPAMLRKLLADRFKLTAHKEKKVLPVYALVVGKNGPKLHEAEAQAGMRMSMSPKGRRMTGAVSIENLADTLSRFMDRPVLDMTGIKGTFDVDLEWTADGGQPGLMLGPPGGGPAEGGGGERRPPENPDAPSIFTAVQETLGLRLEGRKNQVDILIVDRAEKDPTEN
jgi:uncharacterized protein (TIGR03435 family)